jgi:hypothetical protein
MQEHSIIQYTERVAGEIASRHAGEPVAELELWLSLAHQREAMVTQLYESAGIAARLKDGPDSGVHGVIRSVVLGIWHHEESHTRFLSSLRAAAGARPALAELQGVIEGWVTRSALGGSALARALIAAGIGLGRAPDFARELRRMNLLEFIRFSAELETTARMGYQRILQVSSQIDNPQATADDYGFTFQYDVARIECEEAFHEATFHELASWIDTKGEVTPGLSPERCTRTLHRLCARNLSVGAVRRVAAAENARLEIYAPGASNDDWLSEGGLGSLFRRAGLAVPVVELPR